MTAPDLTGLVPLKYKAWVGLIGAALSFAVPYLIEAQKWLPSPWPVVIGVVLFIASGLGVHQAPYLPEGTVVAPAPGPPAPTLPAPSGGWRNPWGRS